MFSLKSFLENSKYAFNRFLGVPIETDLSQYARIALAARRIDLGCESGDALVRRARALRAGISSAIDGTGALPMAAPCFALAAEACRRELGLEPYDQQLIAAAALCCGKVVQLQTGEGKTLAAALAAAFCAMRDGRVHVVTANDYLARRDAEWMGPIYESLGLSVASIGAGASAADRREAYLADIVYITARELGFDYLRDGLAYSTAELVQGAFSSAIVDEADFILIDEARVPLVIAGSVAAPRAGEGREAADADRLARELEPGTDYSVDPEGRRVSLTLAGQAKVEKAFGAGGMHEAVAAPLFARVHAALHAHRLLALDVDYLVRDGEVKVVDAFTGRVAADRHWPWGIHAALEAKEGLAVGAEGRVYGSIAVQHLMGLFPRIAAMTATAVPAAEEFHAVYGMGTVIVPPLRPSRRCDESDAVFWTREAKMLAVAAEIDREHRRGRPVLVGTSSVRESEELAEALEGMGIACALLNARNDEAEAVLIAGAGRRGAVTISTNMAGRGTDIRLDDDPELRGLGGLYVIGTDRHESRRTDDQLRGRAGRQGDPGLTRFFVSLEDPLFERYGARSLLPAAYRRSPAPSGDRIADPAVGREIARAQSVVSARNSAIRRSLRRYSLLVEYDRRYARELRDAALASGDLSLLARLDSAWADHLALVEDVKEGLGLLRYGGKEPGIEYVRIVGGAFETALRDLKDIPSGEGPDGSAGAGIPARPSSTWTYVAEEDALPGFASAIGSLFSAK